MMRMSRSLAPAVLLTCALLQQASAGSTTTAFPAGSLIIPTSTAFQDDCGAVSTYGLIYDVLRAENWLTSNGKTAITVNYVIADGKPSPNRCTPSNLNSAPSASSATASWSDSCDITLSGVAPLVKLVNNSNTSTSSDSAVFTNPDNTASATQLLEAYPAYTNQSLASATTVAYGGGAFVISNAGTDVTNFLALLSGTLVANDSSGAPIDFSQFKTAATCVFGTTHHVNIHRAVAGFTAPVRQTFTSKPPRLAVLDTDINGHTGAIEVAQNAPITVTAASEVSSGSGYTATYTIAGTSFPSALKVGASVSVANVTAMSGSTNLGSEYNGRFTVTAVKTTSPYTFSVTNPYGPLPSTSSGMTGATMTVGGDILQNYLASAGLVFTGAQGCSPNSVLLHTIYCPSTTGSAGQVYDTIDFDDLVNTSSASHTGLYTQDSGVNRYTVLWTPHWETKSSTGGTAGGDGGSDDLTTNEKTALSNINSFLDGPTGLMGECASISSFEGAVIGGTGTSGDGVQDTYSGGLYLQTCVNNGSGACATSTTGYGAAINPNDKPGNAFIGSGSTGYSGTGIGLRNCSDPNVGSGSGGCISYPTPDDAYIQIGEYLWVASNGHVEGYTPNPSTNSIFRPQVTQLVQSYFNGSPLAYNVTRNIKDATPGKGNVLYLGGHDQSVNVAGTKVALQTLLLLGQSTVLPASTIFETSRSTPIVATVSTGTTALVVGSTTEVLPYLSYMVAPVLALPADLTGIEYPFVKGHLRATTLTSVSTTSSAFNSGTVLFDAATTLAAQPVNYSGCGTNSSNVLTFDGSCRAVFTTTTVPSTTTGVALHPTQLILNDTNSGTIGTVITAGLAGWSSASWQSLIERIIAGHCPTTLCSGSQYVPALGGIDRSTVAVIGPSTLATGASTRPTIAYVGASDGMLHAFCASVDSAHGCPSLGTELWAYLPRASLASIRFQQATIEGSPHVIDAFGDFSGSGTKSFRTILTFQTGMGDPTNSSIAQPAVYALDVTDPQHPSVVWEYSIPNPGSSRGTNALGVGLAMDSGAINVGGQISYIAVVQTANGGTNGAADSTAGTFVTALNLQNGSPAWTSPFVYQYPSGSAERVSGDAAVPHTGIPGGAVGVDRQGQGFLTDIVFGDLYGDLWELDATTGISRIANKPIFAMSTDFHPIGAPPAVYSNGTQQFAVIATGGYYDVSDAPLWSSHAPTSAPQMAVAVPLTPTAATINENNAAIPFKFNFTAGENAFSQATIVGTQLFVSTDNTDVNSTGYGTTGASSGHVYSSPLSSTTSVVAVQGGASSVVNNGTSLYTASSNKQQQLSTSTTASSGSLTWTSPSTTGPAVDTFMTAKLSRALWLRTE